MLPTQRIPSAVAAMALGALFALSTGCVSRAPKVDIAPGSQPAPTAPGRWNNQNDGDQTQGLGDSGSLTAVLDERVLKDNFNIDTAKLSYKFSFLGKTDSGAIRFSQGKSRISLRGLKPNQPGTVALEIYEGTALRLKGERPNITLRPGDNQMEMALRLVAPPSTPGTPPNTNPGVTPNTPGQPQQDTSLSINVGIEGSVPTPQNNVQPPAAPQLQPQPSQPWNGIGDRGNETWSIESID
jgi:hypothetical protein